MSVSKKDYDAIAKIIKETNPLVEASKLMIAIRLGNYFKKENRKFCSRKFSKACGYNFDVVSFDIYNPLT